MTNATPASADDTGVARSRVLSDFPYPVAYPYSLLFESSAVPSGRCRALCLTAYQLLRTICLPLVAQYLRRPTSEAPPASIDALDTAVAGIRSPFFSDWVVLARTLGEHLSQVGIDPVFPHLSVALHALWEAKERPAAPHTRARLNPLEALGALHQYTAGQLDEPAAERLLDAYLPVLHQVLDAFAFLGDVELKVCAEGPKAVAGRRAQVRTLKGARPGEAAGEILTAELAGAFAQSEVVLVAVGGQVVPLDPLFRSSREREPLQLYDGHAGEENGEGRGVLYYLGVHQRVKHKPGYARLRNLLDGRSGRTLPGGEPVFRELAVRAAAYSRRTLAELHGREYLPACHLPLTEPERHFANFLTVAQRDTWPEKRGRPAYVNGLLLAGATGAGKTTFLARQAENLLSPLARDASGSTPENPDVVLLLRGDALEARPGDEVLFRAVAVALGVPVGEPGFRNFRELLNSLHGRWPTDEGQVRRFILLVDEVDEAPCPGTAAAEALEMIRTAAGYPWCKVVLAVGPECLAAWVGEFRAAENGPLEALRPFLYASEPFQPSGWRLPVLWLDPLTACQAGAAYARYQEEALSGKERDGGSAVPACTTPWEELPAPTRFLLRNPLHLRLFMEAFDDRRAGDVPGVMALFRAFVQRALKDQEGLREAVEKIMTLLADPGRSSSHLGDEEANALRASGTGRGLVPGPLEALANWGWLRKRVGAEGSSYHFVFRPVAEYLLYRHLLTRIKPSKKDETDSWARRAAVRDCSPEYQKAFGFLIRDWAAAGKVAEAVRLVDGGFNWLRGILATWLVELAQTEHVPGQEGPSAHEAAEALRESGGRGCAVALHTAAVLLPFPRLTMVAVDYGLTAVGLIRALFEKDSRVDIGDGPGVLLNDLGGLLSASGQLQEAMAVFQESDQYCAAAGQPADAGSGPLDSRRALIGSCRCVALNGLGMLYAGTGRPEDAIRTFRQSVEVGESVRQFAAHHAGLGRSLFAAWVKLGELHDAAGERAQAEDAYRQAAAVCEALSRSAPGDRILRHDRGCALGDLGRFLLSTGRLKEAETVLQQAITVFEMARRIGPDSPDSGLGLLSTWTNLGTVRRAAGRSEEAEAAYREAVHLGEELYQSDYSRVDVGGLLVQALSGLGTVLRKSSRSAEAGAAYRRSVDVGEILYWITPGDPTLGSHLSDAFTDLGLVLETDGRMTDAEETYRRGAEVGESAYQFNPQNLNVGYNLGRTLINLGALLWKVGREGDAEAVFGRGVEIGQQLYEAHPEDVTAVRVLVKVLSNLAAFLIHAGRAEDAAVHLSRVTVLREQLRQAAPDDVENKVAYTKVLCYLGRWAEAAPLVEEVLEQVPDHPEANRFREDINARRRTAEGRLARWRAWFAAWGRWRRGR